MAERIVGAGARNRDRPDAAAGLLRARGFRRRAAEAGTAAVHQRSRRLRAPLRRLPGGSSRKAATRRSASRRTACARRRRKSSPASWRSRDAGPIHIHVAEQVSRGRGLPRLARRTAGPLASRPRERRPALVPRPRDAHGRDGEPRPRAPPERSPASARSPKPISATACSTGGGISTRADASASAPIRTSRSAPRRNCGCSNIPSGSPQGRATCLRRHSGSTGRALFDAALAGGAQALARSSGRLAVGARADLVSLDGGHPTLPGKSGDAILDAWIFSAGNALVDCVWSGGRKLVQSGRHASRERIAARFAATMRRLSALG